MMRIQSPTVLSDGVTSFFLTEEFNFRFLFILRESLCGSITCTIHIKINLFSIKCYFGIVKVKQC